MIIDRRCSLALLLVLMLAVAALPRPAQALFTVNFDTDGNGDPIANGQVINDEYTLLNGGIVDSDSGATVGMSVTAENNGGGPHLAVAFDTSLSGTEDPDLEAPFTVTSGPDIDEIRNPGNILIIQENDNGCGDGICDSPDDEAGGPNKFTFEFSDAVTLFSVDLFDVDGTPDNQMETVDMVLKDSAGVVLDTFQNLGTGGDNTAARVLFGSGVLNVALLEVTFSSSGALSNIKGAVPSVSVPAPATLWLLALGLAAAIGRARRIRGTRSA